MLINTMEYIIKFSSKGHILVWTDDNLKHPESREPYQIYILYRILDHVIGLRQNTDRDNSIGH